MKRLVSATKLPASCEYVDEVLRTLFGVGYLDYRKESDWFQTKYGIIKYRIGSTFNDKGSFTIRVYFDWDDFDPNKFLQLVRDCKANWSEYDDDIYVSSSYIDGNSDIGNLNNPQVNIRVKKSNYTY